MGRHHRAIGCRVRAAWISAMITATATAAIRARAALRTVPARLTRTPAVSQRRSTSATSAHTARAQNSASAYTRDKAIEPGVTAQSATISRLIRGSAVSFIPSVARPHAAASPASIVTAKPASAMLTPGSQARESMAAG